VIARSTAVAERSVQRSRDVRVTEAQLPASPDECVGGLRESAFAIGNAPRQPIGNERPSAPLRFDQPVTLERAVRLRDGVRRELELLGERSDGRQASAGAERPSMDPSCQRRRELIRDRLRGTVIERDPHAGIIPRPPSGDV
jgi:hypothetical protein